MLFNPESGTNLAGLGIRVNPAGGLASATPLEPIAPASAVGGDTGTPIAAFPQVAVGAGWRTSLYLSNPGATPAPVTVRFRSDDGGALSLPLSITGNADPAAVTASSVTATIGAYSTLLIEGQPSQSGWTGWAEVSTNTTGAVAGYGVFHYTSPSGVESEGTVPMYAISGSSFTLPFDSIDGFGMGVALANLSSTQSTTVNVTLWNQDGVALSGTSIDLPKGGHTSFMLNDRIPATANSRGFLVFSSTNGAPITGLGLRVNPTGGFTSAPVL